MNKISKIITIISMLFGLYISGWIMLIKPGIHFLHMMINLDFSLVKIIFDLCLIFLSPAIFIVILLIGQYISEEVIDRQNKERGN